VSSYLVAVDDRDSVGSTNVSISSKWGLDIPHPLHDCDCHGYEMCRGHWVAYRVSLSDIFAGLGSKASQGSAGFYPVVQCAVWWWFGGICHKAYVYECWLVAWTTLLLNFAAEHV